MGCFNDLPKDVKWIIFFTAVREEYKKPNYHEIDWNIFTTDYPNPFYFVIASMLRTFSLIDRSCLTLIRSKCYKIGNGWLLQRSALNGLF